MLTLLVVIVATVVLTTAAGARWLENVVLHQPKRWLPDAYVSYDDLLAAAVNSATIGPDVPKDLNNGSGAFRPVEIQHPILGRIPLPNHWTGPGIREQSGSGFTVKAVSRSHGPSERLTVDLSNLDNSTLNLVTGESGTSWPLLHGPVDRLDEGFTFTLPFSKNAVAANRTHQLILKPN